MCPHPGPFATLFVVSVCYFYMCHNDCCYSLALRRLAYHKVFRLISDGFRHDDFHPRTSSLS